jgi:hypothetical protein
LAAANRSNHDTDDDLRRIEQEIDAMHLQIATQIAQFNLVRDMLAEIERMSARGVPLIKTAPASACPVFERDA